MEHQYIESFDPVMKTYRRIYSLDTIRWFFLSEFSDENRNVIKYSVDVEKANDSHYEIDASNAARLAEILDCGNQTNELVTALTSFLSKKGELGFVKLLEDGGIKFQQFHFDDYSVD